VCSCGEIVAGDGTDGKGPESEIETPYLEEIAVADAG